MNEVSTQTVELLVDTLAQRGIPAQRLWDELGITPAQLHGSRVDWELWVAMIEWVQEMFGADAVERLFVPGTGRRTGHTFVRVAGALVSLRELYALFARWGLRRSLMTITARFEPLGAVDARFAVTIDPARVGSLPTLRFITGILRSLPTLQGLPAARVRMEPGATPHHASYRLELPRERSRMARARGLLRMAGGASAALDELEQQASEIASKNAALEQQLAATERAHAALAERDEWLRLALAAGRTGIWRWSPSDRRVRLSDELARLLGLAGQVDLPPDELLPRIHPDDRDRLRDAALAAARARGSFDAECRLVRDGAPVTWLLVKGQVPPGDGALGFVGTVADITEHRAIDERLRFADRLIAAGTLAAGVAHEINNPLGYAGGNLELVRLRVQQLAPGDAELDEMLGEIADGLTRIREVVADLRAFARPEDDAVTRTSPAQACAAALRVVSSMVRHRATVVTDLDRSAPAVMANASRLGQVIINLVVNAADALPDRAPAENRIVVRTRALPTGEAAIEVADNGAGIAPEVLPRVFDPFFTTKAAGAGTGLGLAVCQRIVASLHGRIDVESTVGGGSTFTIVLPPAPPADETVKLPTLGTTGPAVAAATAPAATAAAATAPAATADAASKRRRVLVIDDEPVLRRMLRTMLTNEGWDVVEAPGGKPGLERALHDDLDAVICDVMMPDLDGVDVHAELERQRPALLPRVLFISGGAVSMRARAFAERRDIRMLTKPFSIAQLVEALEALPA